MPDREIFHETTFDYDTLEARLRELAFINKDLAIKLSDKRTGQEELFKYEGGLPEFVQYLNRSEEVIKEPIGEDFREGLTAVVSVQVPEPQLEAQTKVRLNNPEVEGIVAVVINEQLGKYLEENPAPAHKIMKKVILSAEAREAAAKAKKALKDRKSMLNSGGLT